MPSPSKRPRSRHSHTSSPSQPQRTQTSSVTATEAKNEFGRVLERAIKGERVYITRHETPKAVLLSVEDFDALAASLSPAKIKLNTLTAEFDAMLARMQAPGARDAMKAAFDASPKELAIAAARAARKRG